MIAYPSSREELREQLQRRRAHLTVNNQRLASKKITERLMQCDFFQESHNIAAYMPINYEIDPINLVKQAWKCHKRCYLPVLRKKQLVFSIYEEDMTLQSNRFNILEPPVSPESIIEPWTLDLVLVPVLGFTMHGQRLGMGGGYYDRTFSFLLSEPRRNKPQLIGLAYDWQKLTNFQANDWDVPLHTVFTEKSTY